MKTYWYEFDQNNSGGSFVYDSHRGIGPRVWIEANNAEHANQIATDLGIYFDGVNEGWDCECCGDRWHPASDYGEKVDKPEIDREYAFFWNDKIYFHPLGKPFFTVTKENPVLPEPFTFKQ